MKAISGKQVARILKKRGWKLQRITGSHHIFQHPSYSDIISLPIHSNRALSIGLQKYFMKVARIQPSEL